jgi:AraC-like DNA-binding protein
MHYIECPLSARFSPLVAGAWIFEKTKGDKGLDLSYAWPEVGGSLVFTLGDSVHASCGRALPRIALAAGIRSPVALKLPPGTSLVGIRFRSGGMRAFLGVSPAEVGGIDAFGGAWARELFDRLSLLVNGADADADGVVSLLDSALSASPYRRETWLSSARAELKFACSPAQMGIPSLACEQCCSLRSLQRTWPEASGYCPSQYRAVLRCELARFALFLRYPRDLSALALDLGFFDLPHFCRTFKRWTCHTPEAFCRLVEPYRSRFACWGSVLQPVCRSFIEGTCPYRMSG